MPVLVIDKPLGMTSFAVVKTVTRHLRTYLKSGGQGMPDPSRAGHGGTLDPLASGVLPICIGEATKIAPFLLDADKAYEGTITLGVQTDTLDAEGEVVATAHVGPMTEAQIESVLERFRGPIQQVPPMYSALKKDGKPLYAYAREGVSVERASRSLTIFELRVVDFDPAGRLSLSVRCSKGTYIRVLAADIGLALGCGGHLSALRRTAAGPFSLKQSITLEELGRRAALALPLPTVSLSDALRHLPQIVLTEAQADRVGKGQKVPWSDLEPDAEAGTASPLLCLLRPDGTLLAVAERNPEGLASLRRVFLRDGGPEEAPVRNLNSTESSQMPLNDAGNVHSPARDG